MIKTGTPFALLIEHEEKIVRAYRELSEKAVQSNIRYFFKLFLNGHRDIVEKLKAYGKHDVLFDTSGQEKLLSISATEHLVADEAVDLGSLQSVLLYIAKKEAGSMSEFTRLAKQVKAPDMKSYIQKVMDEKMAVATRADRLYHDMIEAKAS